MKHGNEAGLSGRRLLKRSKEEKELAEQEDGLTKDILNRMYFGAPVSVLNRKPF
ncbi:hypothetical protein F5B21DRAFT_486385 [Xylaria acuta]|nr:hypothetical protein F5B21DRAFT_486385 [Xylaria acuta]